MKKIIICLTMFVLPFVVLAQDSGIRMASFSMVEGQAAVLNVFHDAETHCRLNLFFTDWEDNLFLDKHGEPISKVVLFSPSDDNPIRFLFLYSKDVFRDFDLARRQRIQTFAVEFDETGTIPSPGPARPPSNCQELRFSIEVFNEQTRITDYYAWELIPAPESLDSENGETP